MTCNTRQHILAINQPPNNQVGHYGFGMHVDETPMYSGPWHHEPQCAESHAATIAHTTSTTELRVAHETLQFTETRGQRAERDSRHHGQTLSSKHSSCALTLADTSSACGHRHAARRKTLCWLPIASRARLHLMTRPYYMIGYTSAPT